MTELVSLCLLAFAVSVDSFGAGLAYGLRGLELPFKSLMLIGFCSGISVLIGGGTASVLAAYVPSFVTEAIGGGILILIGVWALLQVLKDGRHPASQKEQKASANENRKGFVVQLVHIIRKPDEADLDRSGSINPKEAVFLGAALSLDAFGAGMGASLIGLSPFWLACAVTIMCSLFLAVGMKGGKKLAAFDVVQKLSFVPGVLLICLGLWNLY
ncbi:putative sporulation protein YtaF [Alteribacillus persepolensis]|uniref:Putative sporulation protein YtaF n=1 Tax=Alteribacillus persepolensis TaxID=568899 RepID=A0A1G8BJY2_9BACI|nr:sporulation membrane protein YtaF [Alteribacillus persepolensis]SDH33461.1 putative sporulation protein YtaF [Alteribacillus persepolensis]